MAVEVVAEMSGSVWSIEVAVDDRVEAGGVILVIESMKMEIPVEAPVGGRISQIRVEQGQSVEEGDILAVLD
jgi:acetyl-CoA carboxylase biotin carboxyl carrier protein